MPKAQRNYARQPVSRAKGRDASTTGAQPQPAVHGKNLSKPFLSRSGTAPAKQTRNSGQNRPFSSGQDRSTRSRSGSSNTMMYQGVPLFKMSRKEQEQMRQETRKPVYQLDSDGEVNGNVMLTHEARFGHKSAAMPARSRNKNSTVKTRASQPRQMDGAEPMTEAQGQRNRNHAVGVSRAKKLRVREPNQAIQEKSRRLQKIRENLGAMEPIRLQKALAASGVGSRREMESWIESGLVTINGKKATLGDRVTPQDRVCVKGNSIDIKWPDRLPRILMYHKEEGEIVSRDDPEGRVTIFDRLPQAQSSRWVTVGRLDANTSGLLLLTTSGELANRMMHPSFEVEREYAVRVLGKVTTDMMNSMTQGVPLDDGMATFARIYQQHPKDDDEAASANQWFNVVIKEGRNREVRRMFEHFGLTVSRLMRVRFGNIGLPPRLKRGQFYELNASEVAAAMRWAGLSVTGQKQKA